MTKHFKLKDPASAITHFIGMVAAIIAGIPLLSKAHHANTNINFISLTIFIISMILLYMASTMYHSFNLTEKINKRLKKFDHICISILIAGTYTPVCLIVIGGRTGTLMLCLIWSLAILGILFKIFWVNCPKWVSSVLYIGMGWTCVLSFSNILNSLTHTAFMWLLMGGIFYTIGGIIYSLKVPMFNNRHKVFGTHEIFHVFVLAGSFCHFMLMYNFIAIMPIS